MAITVDWGTKTIHVPRADLFQPGADPNILELNVDWFRLQLKALEESDEGMAYDDTHSHNPPVVISGVPIARVIEIINSYVVEFEDGQYRVILKGANNNILDVSVVNQVSLAPTNSAGLQDLSSLQAASFAGRVALDITSAYTGSLFPVGTRGFPVNNVTDAITIAEERGLREVVILSDMTMTSGDWSEGYAFWGDSPIVLTLVLDPATNVTNCTFRNMTIEGTLDGANVLRECVVKDITFFNGEIFECALDGKIVLGGGIQAGIFDCWSNIPGSEVGNHADIDMGGAGQSLVLRNYSGGIGIENSTGSDKSSIDMNSGRVVFESSVTGGDFTIRGVAIVEDDSGPGAIIKDQTVNADVSDIRKATINEQVTSEATSTLTIKDDDGLGDWKTAQIWEDEAKTQPYRGGPINVREKLE